MVVDRWVDTVPAAPPMGLVRCRYGGEMPEWTTGWRPSTVGEARQYLDAHEVDGEPEIVAACEALFDATPHLSGSVKPSDEQLEERGAD